MRKDTFSNEIFSAYDVLFNSWLQSREAKVPLCCLFSRWGRGREMPLNLCILMGLGLPLLVAGLGLAPFPVGALQHPHLKSMAPRRP